MKESNKKNKRRLVSLINTENKDAESIKQEAKKALEKFDKALEKSSKKEEPIFSKNEEAFNSLLDRIEKQNMGKDKG